MRNNILIRLGLIVAFITINVFQFNAQCTFTGLNPSYCTNSPPSTLSPSITGGIFSGNGISGNVFNPAVAGPGTHTITYATCSNSYVISQPAFAPSSTVGVAVTGLTDDSESGSLPIGFTFKFFCTNYNNFYISSNGFIEFSLTGNGCCAGQPLPSNSNPSNLVAFAWTDLYPPSGGSITYTTTGSSPNRVLVVSFVDLSHYNSAMFCCPITSQIKLYETTNVIEIHTTTKPLSTVAYNTTMGIENSGGTIGFPVPGRSASPTWTAANECYRWSPTLSCLVTQTTIVSPSPTITATGNNSICVGTTSSLTATGNTTYTWNTSSNSSSIGVTPTVTTTYSVSGINSFGCSASSVITVTVDNTPTVTITNSNGTGGSCPNTPLTLTGLGATTYTFSGGIISGVPFTPTISATYTASGANACGIATAAISVSIHPIPPVTASINNPTVCSGSSIILNGGGAVTYTWTGNAGTVPNNTAFAPSATSNYTVKGTSALGCTATAVVGNTVLITPTVVPIATPTAICFGGVSTLSSVGATGYTWTPGTNLFAPTTTVSPPISTTYTLFRTNGACSSSSTVNLVVNPLPLVNASATPSQVCAGSGINLVVIGPITNTWLPGGFTQSNFNVYPNFSTTYTVTGSNGNCTATAVVPVIVNPSPTMAINSPTNAICQGNSVTLTGSGSAQTFTWLPSLNTNNTTEVVSPPTTTIITLSGTNSFGCTSSVTQLMLVNPVPDMSLAGTSGYICAGESATLSVVNQSTNVLYTWNSSTVSPFIVANPVVTTNYAVTGINTQSGCQNSNTITLSVFISTFSVISPTALCKGSTATLTAVGPATSYVWSSNNGNAAPSVTVSPSLTTIYSVTGFNGSCQNTETVSVIVNPLPVVTAVAAKNTICKFEVSTITGSGANSYSWSTGATTPILSFTLSVTTNYTLTGTDLNGCAKSVTVSQFVATCLGMEDLKLNGSAGINVYPNPNNGNFTVSSDVNMSLSITNSLGQVVDTITLKEGNKKEITVSSLPSGIYFLTGQSNDLRINKKIVVDK